MITAIHSEYRKFFSTRSWWVLMLCMFVYIFAMAGLMGGVFAWEAQRQNAPEIVTQMAPMLFGLAPTMGYIFPAIIGAFAWTNEYRHRTILPTFLAEPRRGVVSVAKAVAGIPMGALIGLVGTIGAVGGAALGLVIFGADPQLALAETWKTFGLSVLAMTIWAIVGVGLGMLVTNQIGVIITLLLWNRLIEPLLQMGLVFVKPLKDVPPYLPGSLGDSITGASLFSMMTITTTPEDPTSGTALSAASMPSWEAALLLAAYGVVFAVVGYFLRIRRDVV